MRLSYRRFSCSQERVSHRSWCVVSPAKLQIGKMMHADVPSLPKSLCPNLASHHVDWSIQSCVFGGFCNHI